MQGLGGEPPTIILLSSGHRLSFSQAIRFQSRFHFTSPSLKSPNVFAQTRSFVVHRYLPLSVVSVFVPIRYNRILY